MVKCLKISKMLYFSINYHQSPWKKAMYWTCLAELAVKNNV